MQSKTSFLCLLLLPACSTATDDPSREPPGQPDTADTSSSAGDDGDAETSDPAVPDDSGSDDTSNGDGDESSDGAPDEMPCGDLCLADAPTGWHGPAAVIRSGAADEPPACASSHPTELATMMSDLISPAAVCDCDCGEATDVVCNTGTATLYDDVLCEDFVHSYDIGPSCTNLPEGTGYWQVQLEVSEGECEALTSFTVPDLDFTRWTLCGAAASVGECEYGESCTASPSPEFEESQCIWMAGDVACPGLDYTERSLVFGEILDDRSCGECSCAAPTGSCANGVVGMNLVASCAGYDFSLWEAAPGDCFGEIPVESAEVLVPATPFASCEPTMPASLGGASLDLPYTLCCEPR